MQGFGLMASGLAAASRAGVRWGALASLGLVACSEGGHTPATSDTNFAVRVAPLDLPGVQRVCYDLEVRNQQGALVWSRGTPGLSATPVDPDASDDKALCSDAFGDGPGGAITFIGTCDASTGNRDHTVRLWLDSIWRIPGDDGLDHQLADWQNPCPHVDGGGDADGCVLHAECSENADTPVEFDITVLRRADQGFFDVAVTFTDVYCSAKLDCQTDGTSDEGGPIRLLYHGGEDADTTAVIGFACTAGPGPVDNTVLHMNDIRFRCGFPTANVTGARNVIACESPAGDADDWFYDITWGFEPATPDGFRFVGRGMVQNVARDDVNGTVALSPFSPDIDNALEPDWTNGAWRAFFMRTYEQLPADGGAPARAYGIGIAAQFPSGPTDLRGLAGIDGIFERIIGGTYFRPIVLESIATQDHVAADPATWKVVRRLPVPTGDFHITTPAVQDSATGMMLVVPYFDGGGGAETAPFAGLAYPRDEAAAGTADVYTNYVQLEFPAGAELPDARPVDNGLPNAANLSWCAISSAYAGVVVGSCRFRNELPENQFDELSVPYAWRVLDTNETTVIAGGPHRSAPARRLAVPIDNWDPGSFDYAVVEDADIADDWGQGGFVRVVADSNGPYLVASWIYRELIGASHRFAAIYRWAPAENGTPARWVASRDLAADVNETSLLADPMLTIESVKNGLAFGHIRAEQQRCEQGTHEGEACTSSQDCDGSFCAPVLWPTVFGLPSENATLATPPQLPTWSHWAFAGEGEGCVAGWCEYRALTGMKMRIDSLGPNRLLSARISEGPAAGTYVGAVPADPQDVIRLVAVPLPSVGSTENVSFEPHGFDLRVADLTAASGTLIGQYDFQTSAGSGHRPVALTYRIEGGTPILDATYVADVGKDFDYIELGDGVRRQTEQRGAFALAASCAHLYVRPAREADRSYESFRPFLVERGSNETGAGPFERTVLTDPPLPLIDDEFALAADWMHTVPTATTERILGFIPDGASDGHPGLQWTGDDSDTAVWEADPADLGDADGIYQYALYYGDEQLDCNGVPCNKRYMNIALGYVAGTPSCWIDYDATASDGPFANGLTPLGRYPVVHYSVQITSEDGKLACGQNALDGKGGVSTQYTPIEVPDDVATQFCYALGPGGHIVDTCAGVNHIHPSEGNFLYAGDLAAHDTSAKPAAPAPTPPN